MARDEILHTRLFVAVIFLMSAVIIPVNAAGEVLFDDTVVFYEHAQ